MFKCNQCLAGTCDMHTAAYAKKCHEWRDGHGDKVTHQDLYDECPSCAAKEDDLQILRARLSERESVDRWQTMDTAPKDRAILLLIETCWLPLPWVGCWSYGREDWNVYLPFKTGDKNTTTYGFTPMGWMDIPKANEIEGQKPHG